MATTATCSPPTTLIYLSPVASACNAFCNSSYLINTPRATTNNHNFAAVEIGDIISGASLTPGWYAYAASSTATSGTFRIMQVDSSNQITSLAECDSGSCAII